MTEGSAMYAVANVLGSNTIATVSGLRIAYTQSSGSTNVTDAKLLNIGNITNTAGTITNTYGLYIGNLTAGTQTNTPYSIYAGDLNARNFLGGMTGIGIAAPTNALHVNAAANPLRLVGLQNGAGTDQVMTVDATGVVHQQAAASVSSANAWSLLGHAGTADGTNFIGTTDDVPFNVRVNNEPAGRIDNTLFNTFWGYQAGSLNAKGKGSYNTANGHQALYSNIEGSENTATGYQALYSNITGTQNTAHGVSALFSNTEGIQNTANGYQALYSNITGNLNTAHGVFALQSNIKGSNNSANGFSALQLNTDGSQNTANGVSALQSNNGDNNTALGYQSLSTNTTGSNNTALGYGADVARAELTNATAIGYSAVVGASNNLVLGGTGENIVNVGIGNAVPSNTLHVTAAANPLRLEGLQTGAGTDQVMTIDATGVVRQQTAASVSSANAWSLLGNAGTVDGTNFIGTTDNVALNFRANNQKAGRIDPLGPVFLGYQAGNTNADNSSTGIGYQALFSNTTGPRNTATGYQSLFSNTTGINNTANGYRSLYSNISGFNNTDNGREALYNNTTGQANTAIGYQAIYSNTTGATNTANGGYALFSNTTGNYNTASGYRSLFSNTTANENTANGYFHFTLMPQAAPILPMAIMLFIPAL